MKFVFPVLLFFSLSSFAARVELVVRASPCTGGPTTCAALATTGKIRISEAGLEKGTLRVEKDATTEVRLEPGRYTFQYIVTSPVGGSAPVEQDIVSLGKRYNLVVLEFDTGIR